MEKIIITTECVADLPEEQIRQYQIGIIYYDVATEEGVFKDTVEIDAANLMEYIGDRKRRAQSVVPSPAEYQALFAEKLKEYDSIVHIAVSGAISVAYTHATEAREALGADAERVTIVDSKHLSSGQGILAVEAAKMRDQGKSREEIVDRVNALIPLVNTAFIAYNADYLYYNGKASKKVRFLCNALHLHPVLYMRQDGKLSVKRIYIGNYNRACRRYVRDTLRKYKDVDTSVGYVTYAGCTHEYLGKVQEDIERYLPLQMIYEVQASAAVSCNCGPETFGILYKRKG